MASEGTPYSQLIHVVWNQMYLSSFPRMIFIHYTGTEFTVEENSVPIFHIKDPPPLPTVINWHEPPTKTFSTLCSICFTEDSQQPLTYISETIANTLLTNYSLSYRTGRICLKHVNQIDFQINDRFESKFDLNEAEYKPVFGSIDIIRQVLACLDRPSSLINFAATCKFHYNLTMSPAVWSQYARHNFLDHLFDPFGKFSSLPICCGYKYAAHRHWRYKSNMLSCGNITKDTPNNAIWDNLMAMLPEQEPRMVVFSLNHPAHDGLHYVFLLWIPDASKIRPKMIFAGNKDTIKKIFRGVQVEVQLTEKVCYDFVEGLIWNKNLM